MRKKIALRPLSILLFVVSALILKNVVKVENTPNLSAVAGKIGYILGICIIVLGIIILIYGLYKYKTSKKNY